MEASERSRLTAAGIGAAALGAVLAWRRATRYDLEGRVALVTGGSRGLGLVLARELARRGARVAICARDASELDRAVTDLETRDAEVHAVPCDLADPEQIRAMVASVERRFGRVDVLVNNAGIIQVGPVDTMREEDFARAMDVHFWAPLRTIEAVLPGMLARGEGRIVNISSIGGRISVPHLLPYGASKFALTGLSRGLRAELAPRGIRVTTVYPGLLRTGSQLNARFKGRNQSEYAWFLLMGSIPGLTVAAPRAARQVVRAIERGRPEVVLGLPWRAAVLAHDLAPSTAARMLALMDRLLPRPDGGIGDDEVAGHESESPLTASWVTALSRRAAARNNEVPGNGGSR